MNKFIGFFPALIRSIVRTFQLQSGVSSVWVGADKRWLLVCYGRMALDVSFTGEAHLDGHTLILPRRIPRQPVDDPTDEPLLVDVRKLFQPK